MCSTAAAGTFWAYRRLGVLSVTAWVAVTIFIVFTILKATVGLRVSATEEIRGLDIEEHGLVSSYADFMPMMSQGEIPLGEEISLPQEAAPVEKAIPVVVSKVKNERFRCRRQEDVQRRDHYQAIEV